MSCYLGDMVLFFSHKTTLEYWQRYCQKVITGARPVRASPPSIVGSLDPGGGAGAYHPAMPLTLTLGFINTFDTAPSATIKGYFREIY